MNAMQLGKRLAGSLDRARATMGRSASGNERRSGCSCMCCWAKLADVLAVEGPLAGQQFLVDDGQAVLIAAVANLALEGFRRRVQRRDAAEEAGCRLAFQVLDQAEIGDLDAVADEEQIARLDVEVLQLVLFVHVVERFGGVAQVAQQIVARNADQAGVLAARRTDRAGCGRPIP